MMCPLGVRVRSWCAPTIVILQPTHVAEASARLSGQVGATLTPASENGQKPTSLTD
jgi:hypothetical protein